MKGGLTGKGLIGQKDVLDIHGAGHLGVDPKAKARLTSTDVEFVASREKLRALETYLLSLVHSAEVGWLLVWSVSLRFSSLFFRATTARSHGPPLAVRPLGRAIQPQSGGGLLVAGEEPGRVLSSSSASRRIERPTTLPPSLVHSVEVEVRVGSPGGLLLPLRVS